MIEQPYQQAVQRVRRIVAEGDIGLICNAMTPWHALGVDALLHRMRAAGDGRRGVVLMLPNLAGGRDIDPDHMPLCRDDGHVEFLAVSHVMATTTAGRIGQYAATVAGLARLALARPHRDPADDRPAIAIGSPGNLSAAILLLAHLCSRPLLRGRRIGLLQIDEGIGSYYHGSWSEARKTERPPGGWFLPVPWLDDAAHALWRAAQRTITRRFDTQTQHVFTQPAPGQPLQLTPGVAEAYRRAMLAHDLPDGEVRAHDRPIALLLPQPWIKSGQLADRDEMQLLGRVAERLFAAGMDLWIKPHPREDPARYRAIAAEHADRCRVLPRGYAAELLYAALRPRDIVIGFNSSSLITAALLFEAQTYTLGDILTDSGRAGAWFSRIQQTFRDLAGTAVRDYRERFGSPTD